MVRRSSWSHRSRPILGGMSDEFQFGEPAKRPARLGGARPPRAKGTFDLRVLWLVAGLIAAAVFAFVALSGADEAGKAIADAESNTVAQIDRAYDAAAQGTVGRAVMVAQTLLAEQGSFPTDLATLSASDPGLRFTSGPSNDPSKVSYAVRGSDFGAAVRSESGTCWWVRIAATGVTTYGSGSACTGNAAMAASAPSW
jgi:hypothetical protein